MSNMCSQRHLLIVVFVREAGLAWLSSALAVNMLRNSRCRVIA